MVTEEQTPVESVTFEKYGISDFVVVVQSLVMSDSLQPHGLQHARLPCHSDFPVIHYLPEFAQTHVH